MASTAVYNAIEMVGNSGFDSDEENDGYYSEEFYYLPQIELKEKEDIARQLVAAVHAYNLSLISFRELGW